MELNLDWSFYSWDLLRDFVVRGFWFSITLTLVATLGGIFSAPFWP